MPMHTDARFCIRDVHLLLTFAGPTRSNQNGSLQTSVLPLQQGLGRETRWGKSTFLLNYTHNELT